MFRTQAGGLHTDCRRIRAAVLKGIGPERPFIEILGVAGKNPPAYRILPAVEFRHTYCIVLFRSLCATVNSNE